MEIHNTQLIHEGSAAGYGTADFTCCAVTDQSTPHEDCPIARKLRRSFLFDYLKRISAVLAIYKIFLISLKRFFIIFVSEQKFMSC